MRCRLLCIFIFLTCPLAHSESARFGFRTEAGTSWVNVWARHTAWAPYLGAQMMTSVTKGDFGVYFDYNPIPWDNGSWLHAVNYGLVGRFRPVSVFAASFKMDVVGVGILLFCSLIDCSGSTTWSGYGSTFPFSVGGALEFPIIGRTFTIRPTIGARYFFSPVPFLLGDPNQLRMTSVDMSLAFQF